MYFFRLSANITILFLLSVIFQSSVNYAQTPARDRVVAKPTPTPTAAPTLTPTPAVTPTLTVKLQSTVADLQTNIRRVLQNPALTRGQVGVKIVSLDSGKTLFEENAEKLFMPASNMKSFTFAAALDRLTPDFRFITNVYAAQPPDSAGTVRGDLTIFGRGDPTFAASLNDGDYYKAINVLADKIAAAGVKRIEGNLVGDESYFSGDALGSTWEWDDLQWYYGTGVSALTINDNSVDLKILPGANVGAPCLVQILPINVFALTNTCTTQASGAKREIAVTKKLGANNLEVRGAMPLNDAKGYSGAIAIEKPAEMFVSLLKNSLLQKGITVTGQTRVVGAKDKINLPAEIRAPQIEIVRLESAPLSFVAAKTLKPSQNLYTELTLRALGEAVGDKSDAKKTSAERGLEVVQKFLTEAGIQPNSVIQFDGSGLSRHDLITPAAAVQLYSFMSRHRSAATFRAALPIGGFDGTLKSRFQNSAAANNVYAKTGTIDQVGTLSGYVNTASGERLAFSILTNNLPDGSTRRAAMDDIVLLLANFNGKSQ